VVHIKFIGGLVLSKGLVRVRTWKEFKQLVIETKPDYVVYIIEQNGLSASKEATVLKTDSTSSASLLHLP